MFRITAALSTLMLSVSHDLHAQSESASAGFFGMILTPVGAFTPVVSGKPNTLARSTGAQLRLSRWQFGDGDDETTNIGAGIVLVRGRARTAIEVGYVRNEQCSECGVLMAGADLLFDLAHSTGSGPMLMASLNPAVGFGRPREGGGSAIGAGLSIPLSASLDAGSRLRVVLRAFKCQAMAQTVDLNGCPRMPQISQIALMKKKRAEKNGDHADG